MLRIILIAIISLITVLIPFVIIAGIEDDASPLFVLYVLIMLIGNYFFPTLIAAFIFYFLVKKILPKKVTTRIKWLTWFLFLLSCELIFHLWPVGEWIISGDLTWDSFKHRYNVDFIFGNYPILIGGTLLTYLYFVGFLSSINSSPRLIPNDQTNDN
jgi:hypothetical protein